MKLIPGMQNVISIASGGAIIAGGGGGGSGSGSEQNDSFAWFSDYNSASGGGGGGGAGIPAGSGGTTSGVAGAQPVDLEVKILVALAVLVEMIQRQKVELGEQVEILVNLVEMLLVVKV